MRVRRHSAYNDELDAGLAHPIVGGVEVVNPQKQPHAAGELVADRLRLELAIGLRQKQRRRRAGR